MTHALGAAILKRDRTLDKYRMSGRKKITMETLTPLFRIISVTRCFEYMAKMK